MSGKSEKSKSFSLECGGEILNDEQLAIAFVKFTRQFLAFDVH